MATTLRRFVIHGIYPVSPTNAELEEAMAMLWGTNLNGSQLAAAQSAVAEHFKGLYLFEVELDPPGFEIQWEQVTQPIEGQPASNWQVPYDEQPVDGDPCRWIFFLHCVDFDNPLFTPLGPVELPAPSSRPARLASFRYEVPG